MKSLLSKILVWSAGALALSFIAFAAIVLMISARVFEEHDLLGSLNMMQANGAVEAYSRGGAPRLQSYLNLLKQYLQIQAEYHLVDDKGADLITGSDMTGLLAEGAPARRLFAPFRSRMVIAMPVAGQKFTFILVTKPPVGFRDFLPYYLLTVIAVGLLDCLLVSRLVAPIKSMSRTVERFGTGDLACRMNSSREDEIGALSRAFDEMAGRIQSLLQAERQLLRDVSHELRSPLARLGFAVELARTAETRDQALCQMRREIERLSGLIDLLLQTARGESDAAQLNLEEIPLDGLLREIMERCRIEADARQCRISLSGEEATIVGDRELLDRAIENVLRNALRQSPRESVVDISLAAENGRAIIAIRDRGPGVPSESLESIFKPFFRLGSSPSAHSIGLGLSITQRAIALHKGTIRAENRSPGLQVTIELPQAARSSSLGLLQA